MLDKLFYYDNRSCRKFRLITFIVCSTMKVYSSQTPMIEKKVLVLVFSLVLRYCIFYCYFCFQWPCLFSLTENNKKDSSSESICTYRFEPGWISSRNGSFGNCLSMPHQLFYTASSVIQKKKDFDGYASPGQEIISLVKVTAVIAVVLVIVMITIINET